MTKDGRKIVGDKRTVGDRQKDDFYKTSDFGTIALLEKENVKGRVLEPACGDGAISRILEKSDGVDSVTSIDIVDRGYGEVKDYFEYKPKEKFDWVITNPPYKYGLEFVKKALKDVKNDGKVAMLLKLVFLESQKRYNFFQTHPPTRIHVFSKRLGIWKNGNEKRNSGLVCYAWFIWEKGNKKNPKLDWICESA